MSMNKEKEARYEKFKKRFSDFFWWAPLTGVIADIIAIAGLRTFRSSTQQINASDLSTNHQSFNPPILGVFTLDDAIFLTGLFIPGIAVGEFGLTPYMLFTVLAVGGYGFQILTGERRLIKPVGYIFLLLFIGITTLSLLIVQDFRAAIGVYARTVLQWALFFLLVQVLVDQKSASRLIRILLIQAVIVVGWGIISGVQLNYFGVIERESFFWTQFQKNDFATYLAVVLTLALATDENKTH